VPDPQPTVPPSPSGATVPGQAPPGPVAPAADDGARRVFHHLLGNTLAASVVNFTVWFAVTFWVYLETGSVFATGVISGIYLVFTTASGIWFGGLVDRHPKRGVMLGSSGVSLLCYSAALVVYLLTEPSSFTDPTSPALWTLVLLLMGGVIVGNLRAIALSTGRGPASTCRYRISPCERPTAHGRSSSKRPSTHRPAQARRRSRSSPMDPTLAAISSGRGHSPPRRIGFVRRDLPCSR